MGRPKKYKDISIGDIYNRWTVIGEKRDIPKKNSKGFTHQWYCECSCENHTRKWVTDNQLTSGRSKSCGCLRKETSIKQNNCKVKVLKTDAKWFGVTYKEDKEKVVEALKEMTDDNIYPSPLWK